MKWYGISGSWRYESPELKKDIGKIVMEILTSGNGIITGGALGVDYIATQTVLDNGDVRRQLRLYLPVSLENYCAHFYKRAEEEVIVKGQADMLATQLRTVHEKCPKCISDDWGFLEVTNVSYYARTVKVAEDCDELYAFHVNKTKGTQDAIDETRKLGKPVHVEKYKIP